MNILICSAGRRVKLIEYFKEELHKVNGKVIAIDCDSSAPALYHADFFEVAPRIDHPDYLPYLKDVCHKYNVKGILSLIDPELELLAGWKDEFEKDAICVIISNEETINICFDKFLTYTFLQEQGVPVIPTYLSIKEVIDHINKQKLHFPLIVKPRKGSASIGIHKVNSITELETCKDYSKDIIIQPFINSEEYGVDCYIDLITQDITNLFMKKKIAMRAGETDKSIAIKDPQLKQVIEQLISVLKPLGPIDIDCFKTKSGYVVSEINPRFGGGYPHAHEMNQNFIRNIINNISGTSNIPNTEDYRAGTISVKFDQLMILEKD